MKHPFIGTKQTLVATLLILMGLSTYGCGDTATLSPETTLANLTVNTETADATMDPAFNPEATSYTVNLSNNITTVTITAQPAVAGDTVTIDGQTTMSRSIDLGPSATTESTKTVGIVVSNPPSSSRTYVVTLKRAGLEGNNSLRGLTVSPGTPPISFEKNTRNYTVSVLNTIDRVTVTPILDDPAATMTVNGQPATSGQARTISPLNPAGQSTTITILVRAQNGTEQPYTITVSRGVSNNNRLQTFTISPGSPGTLNLRPNVTNYTVGVGSNVTSVTVRPTLADATARMSMSVGGGQPTNINSGEARSIPLRSGGLSTLINILVTAQNNTQRLYTVEVIPAPLGGNNNLQSLTVPSHTLVPPFDQNRARTDYDLSVINSVDSITVNASPQDTGARARIFVNGASSTNSISLPPGPSTTEIEIIVRAPNGTEKSYFITVSREALPPPSGNNNLSALTVSSRTLNVNANTTQYTVNVRSTVTSVTVTARLQDAAASMTINGQGTSSGVASAPITLGEPGSNTDISIIVKAPNDNLKTYTITVRKRPSAPDLISEDDSCPLFEPPDPLDPNKCAAGSREDNLTNVTTPRFSIQLDAGETAQLYVDGRNVASEFDQSSSTIKPTGPLSNGNRSITYTVTNSASLESPQSDPLEVTIDTVAP